MAFPTGFTLPKTWAAGETIQADGSSGLNTQIRDNTLMGGEHVLAQTVTTSTASASIDLVQLPQSWYEALRLSIRGRTEAALTNQVVTLQFSSSSSTAPGYSTGSNYDHMGILSGGGAGTTNFFGAGTTYAHIGQVSGGNATADAFGQIDVLISGYTRGQRKTVNSQFGAIYNSTSGESIAGIAHADWRSTSPAHAIRLAPLSGNWSSGVVVTLYGRRTTATSS